MEVIVRPRHTWVDNIKMELREISRFHKMLGNLQLPEKGSPPWSQTFFFLSFPLWCEVFNLI
jgi:hypothetical protein